MAASLRIGVVLMLTVMVYVVARLWVLGQLDVAAVLVSALLLGASAAFILTVNGLSEGVRQVRRGLLSGLITMGMSLLPTASVAWAIAEALEAGSVVEVPGIRFESGVAIALFAIVATLVFHLGEAMGDARRLGASLARKFVEDGKGDETIVEIY